MVDGCPPDARRSHVEWLRYVHCVLALAMFAVLSCPSPTFPWSFTLSGICCRALNTGSRFMDAPAMDVAHYHGDETIITHCHLRGCPGWCLAHPPIPPAHPKQAFAVRVVPLQAPVGDHKLLGRRVWRSFFCFDPLLGGTSHPHFVRNQRRPRVVTHPVFRGRYGYVVHSI